MRTIHLAVKDLRQILGDWKSTFFLVAMPVLFTLFFGFVLSPQSSGEGGGLPLGWSNQAGGSLLVDSLRTQLAGSGSIHVIDSAGQGIETLEQQVRAGELAGALVIPHGYAQVDVREDWPPVTLIVNPDGPAGQAVRAAVALAFSRLEAARQMALISGDRYQVQADFADEAEHAAYLWQGLQIGMAAWSNPPVRVSVEKGTRDSAAEGASATGFSQASPGMIVQFAIFGLITSAMVLVIERKSGALGRLMTTPLRKVELIGGHTLAMFLVILLQEIVLVVLGQLAFDVDYARSPAATGLMIVSLALWGASLGLLIGAISKSQEQVIMLSLAAMFLFSGLGGAWFPLEAAGDTFSAIGHLTPAAWAMDGFQNIVVRGLGVQSILVPAGILLAYTVVLFGLAVWRFRFE